MYISLPLLLSVSITDIHFSPSFLRASLSGRVVLTLTFRLHLLVIAIHHHRVVTGKSQHHQHAPHSYQTTTATHRSSGLSLPARVGGQKQALKEV